MRLNNKGFAFSTMLYGTITLITLVLYAILNISKASVDTTYYYGDSIRLKLNECVNDEIQLEKCYSSSVGSCDTKPYHICLGISDDTTSVTGLIASEMLKEKVVTSGNGLYEDSKTPKRYFYRGTDVNNYIQYSGKLWRIVSVESDGSLRLIDYSNPISLKWDYGTIGDGLEFSRSTLKNYLDNQYMQTITDEAKLISGRWESTLIYPSMSAGTNFSLDDLYSLKDSQISISVFYSKNGILSIEDYMTASLSSNCQTKILQSSGCNSWLADYKGWTINLNAEETSSNIAYHFANDNKLVEDNVSSEFNVYPVIYLDRNIVIQGEGTLSNPYVIQ